MKKLKRMNELCNTLPWFVGWDGSCFSINKGDGEASFLWFFYSYICWYLYYSYVDELWKLDKSRSKISQKRGSVIWRWMNENKTPRSKERDSVLLLLNMRKRMTKIQKGDNNEIKKRTR